MDMCQEKIENIMLKDLVLQNYANGQELHPLKGWYLSVLENNASKRLKEVKL